MAIDLFHDSEYWTIRESLLLDRLPPNCPELRMVSTPEERTTGYGGYRRFFITWKMLEPPQRFLSAPSFFSLHFRCSYWWSSQGLVSSAHGRVVGTADHRVICVGVRDACQYAVSSTHLFVRFLFLDLADRRA